MTKDNESFVLRVNFFLVAEEKSSKGRPEVSGFLKKKEVSLTSKSPLKEDSISNEEK